MAEERLIDDDKDRKYKIRKNADGEDELIIDDSPEEEEPAEEIGFEVPELEDDEEAAVMTPEQLAERERQRAEEEEKRRKSILTRAEHAKALISEGRFDDALCALEEAERLGKDGLVSALRLQALTRCYTDFSRIEECSDAADGVRGFADNSVKAEHAAYMADISVRAERLGAQVRELGDENERQRAQRQVKFVAKRNRAAIWFAVTAVPMLAFAALSIYFASVMHAAQDDYTNMILCFVFAGLAGAFFIASLFTAHRLWDGARLLKLNSKNSSTKLGREYEAKRAELGLLDKIVQAFKEDV